MRSKTHAKSSNRPPCSAAKCQEDPSRRVHALPLALAAHSKVPSRLNAQSVECSPPMGKQQPKNPSWARSVEKNWSQKREPWPASELLRKASPAGCSSALRVLEVPEHASAWLRAGLKTESGWPHCCFPKMLHCWVSGRSCPSSQRRPRCPAGQAHAIAPVTEACLVTPWQRRPPNAAPQACCIPASRTTFAA
jgi:hypothetical protein